MPSVEEAIEKRVGEVRLDALDLSYGELISLYAQNEFVITPDFQRFFRWSEGQRSRLIESVLLGLPIPQIFVVENQSSVYELVDGLQRISSVIQFIQPQLLENKEALVLTSCDLVPELNGLKFEDLSLTLRLQIKRSKVRAVVIKRQSSLRLRYEMFKRLNTGGSPLSDQEVRNCTALMIGESGKQFYQFLQQCSVNTNFLSCTSTLPESVRDQRGGEELVLRFFALKNSSDLFKGSVVDWLDNYLEAVIFERVPFNYETQKADFDSLFRFLDNVLGDGAFVRYRGTNPIGGLAPAYFEAITLGVWETLPRIRGLASAAVKDKIVRTVQTDDFRLAVGSGSNSQYKFKRRVELVQNALLELTQ